MDLKINFINILPKDSWLDIDGAGTFQERRKRVVLSSCAVMCIRNFLSSTGARGRVASVMQMNEKTGFKHVHELNKQRKIQVCIFLGNYQLTTGNKY